MQAVGTPIGLQLAHSAKHVGRAFNDALAQVGGSMPMWFILTNLKGEAWRTQHELARALRIEGPTLTRHLDGRPEDLPGGLGSGLAGHDIGPVDGERH